MTTECRIIDNQLKDIQCHGCPSFDDSLLAIRNLLGSDDSLPLPDSDGHAGFCCHTMLLEHVRSVIANENDLNHQFNAFVSKEISTNSAVTPLNVYGDTIKWLVVLSEEESNEENVSLHATCRTTTYASEIFFIVSLCDVCEGKIENFVRVKYMLNNCAHICAKSFTTHKL